MSVTVLHPEIMSYIHAGLTITAYRSTCDIYHSSTMYTHFRNRTVEKETTRIIESWCELNRLSYWVAYNDKPSNMYPFIKFDTLRKINIYQLLKYVACLEYNIEMSTIASSKNDVDGVPDITNLMKEDHKLLKRWRLEIQNAIISNILEYDLACWSEIPGTKRELAPYEQQYINDNKTIVVKKLTAPL